MVPFKACFGTSCIGRRLTREGSIAEPKDVMKITSIEKTRLIAVRERKPVSTSRVDRMVSVRG